MTKVTNALYPTLAHNLGLTSRELAEIGGFSERFARDLLAGRKPFPKDIQKNLLDIQDDIDTLTDQLIAEVHEGGGHIVTYRTNDELRNARPDIPERGHAQGGFLRPYGMAALAAMDFLKEEDGIDVDILFKG